MVRLENEYAIVELSNGIIVGTLKPDIVDKLIAQKAVISRLELSHGKSFPFLINIKSVKTVTKEARDFLASEEGCKGVTAASILIDSVIGSMIGNFFIRISKPLVPTRLFTNEEDAKKWLFKFSS